MKKLLLAFALLCFMLPVSAQVEWESQIWTSAEFNYNFKGPWSIGFSPEVRFRTQPFMVRTIFPDITAGYKVNKHFGFTVHYRYQYTNEGMGNYIVSNSYLIDGMYKNKFDKFQFGFRLRAGTVEDDTPNPEITQLESWEVREKFSLSYDLKKKMEVFSSVEFFQLPVQSWTHVNQLRITTGLEYALNKSQQLQIGLMFQDKKDVKRLNPVISYSIDLDKLKKKEKKVE